MEYSEKPIISHAPSVKNKVVFLSDPRSHIDEPAQVITIETHMSWIFMTKDLVYKMKKPIRHDLVDLSSLDERYHNCYEEIRLNRRLAPGVYLQVVPITQNDRGQLALCGDGKTVDWLVKMKRLPKDRMLNNLIRTQQLTKRDIQHVAQILVDFYQSKKPEDISAFEYHQRFSNDISTNHEVLHHYGMHFPVGQLNKTTEAQLHFLISQPDVFRKRIELKRIIEAHGDLRPEHICIDEQPVFIDCLEFSLELRLLDPVHELAFLSMECAFVGADYIEPIIFETYFKATSDDAPAELINFYKAYRATQRTKQAILHIKDHKPNQHSKWIKQARAYLALAEQYCSLL